MKVQRVRLPEIDCFSWLVLDDNYVPINPILSYLKFLHNLDRSPYTIRATAHHLKLFWEYLRDAHLDWTEVDVAQLAAFITWLRLPNPSMISLEFQDARRTNATIDQILTAVHAFYDFQIRMKTVPNLPLYQFVMMPHRQYKPFLHGIAKSKPTRVRVISLKREKRLAKTLPKDQVQQLLDACSHVRDRFLVALLYDTGMRIGQVLGLRHEDVLVEDGAIRIVPRDDNVNGARAKRREPYLVYPSSEIMDLYVEYLISDLGALEADHLPDYVFVNLWEGEIGRPMTYAAVRSLCLRLGKRISKKAQSTEIVHFTPHQLRHTRATEWIRDDKLPLPTVSRLLGHASIQTTHDTYIHLTDEDTRAELEKARKRSKDEQ